MSNTGVHESHCCARHGCKYGDDDCPVVQGRVEQLYPCEDCDYETRRVEAAMQKAVELGLIADTPESRSALAEVIKAANAAFF
ncbi:MULTISPECIES: hypothetical protein [Pseudomonas]|uniref:hypothetical protein n=1 Tax=Pseudomonas TaxID=286 RepID=UPI0009BEC56E|nr:MULTISPECIES: hypothetical protein [Pseudomonas]